MPKSDNERNSGKCLEISITPSACSGKIKTPYVVALIHFHSQPVTKTRQPNQ